MYDCMSIINSNLMYLLILLPFTVYILLSPSPIALNFNTYIVDYHTFGIKYSIHRIHQSTTTSSFRRENVRCKKPKIPIGYSITILHY